LIAWCAHTLSYHTSKQSSARSKHSATWFRLIGL
jgi:hypothetical protein